MAAQGAKMTPPSPPNESGIWIAALAIAVVLAVTPTAVADHDPDYQDTEGPLALDDVATDGYVVTASRIAGGFQVQVEHADAAGFASGTVNLSEPGGNAGAWLHGADAPLQGDHPEQTVALSEDNRTLIIRDINASGWHSVVFVVPIDVDEGQSWVAGSYNAAKFWAPHDSLDATFTPVNL